VSVVISSELHTYALLYKRSYDSLLKFRSELGMVMTRTVKRTVRDTIWPMFKDLCPSGAVSMMESLLEELWSFGSIFEKALLRAGAFHPLWKLPQLQPTAYVTSFIDSHLTRFGMSYSAFVPPTLRGTLHEVVGYPESRHFVTASATIVKTIPTSPDEVYLIDGSVELNAQLQSGALARILELARTRGFCILVKVPIPLEFFDYELGQFAIAKPFTMNSEGILLGKAVLNYTTKKTTSLVTLAQLAMNPYPLWYPVDVEPRVALKDHSAILQYSVQKVVKGEDILLSPLDQASVNPRS
jgi:hypothetical protein